MSCSTFAHAEDSGDLAISVQSITKRFGATVRLGKPDAKSLNTVLKTVFGKPRFRAGNKRVHAVDLSIKTLFEDFSLNIRRGSCVGLVGPSGSGKTVLLKILSGVKPVEKGRIEIYGSVVSLLDLGGNLEPALTIWENAEIFCKFSHKPKDATEAFYKAVLEFAELGKFEDVPIRYFSTGMQTRLSVAMTLLSDADIILIDDVLEVGDISFQERCFLQLEALRDAGKTIVTVMENQAAISRISDRLIRLSGGHIVADEINTEIENWQAPAERFQWLMTSYEAENDLVEVLSADASQIENDDKPFLRLVFSCKTKLRQTLRPLVDIRSGRVSVLRTVWKESIHIECDDPQELSFSVDLPVHMLAAGVFEIDLGFLSVVGDDHHGLKTWGMLVLKVLADPTSSQDEDDKEAIAAVFAPDLEWTINKLEGGSL